MCIEVRAGAYATAVCLRYMGRVFRIHSCIRSYIHETVKPFTYTTGYGFKVYSCESCIACTCHAMREKRRREKSGEGVRRAGGPRSSVASASLRGTVGADPPQRCGRRAGLSRGGAAITPRRRHPLSPGSRSARRSRASGGGCGSGASTRKSGTSSARSPRTS